MLKGTIAKFYWGNPHNESRRSTSRTRRATITQWVAYTEPPLVMLERGWTRKSLNFGDEVTVYIFAAKNGSTVGTLNRDRVGRTAKSWWRIRAPGAPQLRTREVEKLQSESWKATCEIFSVTCRRSRGICGRR